MVKNGEAFFWKKCEMIRRFRPMSISDRISIDVSLAKRDANLHIYTCLFYVGDMLKKSFD